MPSKVRCGVSPSLLGRTNQAFPPIWLSLAAPQGVEPENLVSTALAAKTVFDISSGPALWGGLMRGQPSTLLYRAGEYIEHATSERHASDLLQAQLIQVLSSIGRSQIDFFFLKVRRGLEEFQINGALQAMEEARQDGLVRWLGFSAEGPALAALGLWQFHDAFDVLLVPRSHYDEDAYQTLAALAEERRVGVVTTDPFTWAGQDVSGLADWGGETHDLARLKNLTQSFYGVSLKQAILADLSQQHPLLVSVSSAAGVQEAMGALTKSLPEGFASLLDEFKLAAGAKA